MTPPSYSSVNILIVDDEPSNLITLSSLLEKEGYVVRQALDGQMALDTVGAFLPDLILLDIRMPLMDGYEVCTQLKADQRTGSVPVIFLSALNDALDKTKAFSIGGADYITKPFQVSEVLTRIQHQLTIQSQQKQLLALNQQLQDFNTTLEEQIRIRTLELEQALAFERTLKRIAEQVRDTLDPNRILQAAVTELALVLECICCDAVLHDVDRITSTVCHQCIRVEGLASHRPLIQTINISEIYHQLTPHHWFAFCPLQPQPEQHPLAILIFPIFDQQVTQPHISGTVWLFKPMHASFTEREIYLVEQVVNQCAIALRQAQLYAASQQQVKELERLNTLKNDFLNTISHELRSPLASMKIALQLLDHLSSGGETLTEQLAQPKSSDNQAAMYFEILKQECDREFQLVQDLLNLQYIEAGVHVGQLITIRLSEWLHHVVEPFHTRIQQQQQHLKLNIEVDLPPISTDLTSLNRVIVELLTNACKYTPTNGIIHVSARSRSTHIEIGISNTGIEIPEAELDRIFDKFYRIPNSDPWKYSGTGLGLALVKKLVEQLHGQIYVKSNSGQTAFILEFPLSSPVS